MAGLPWVKVATDFADHPKAIALANRLADPRAALHLPPVWGHFARHYADGSMPDTEDAIRALERAALWGGQPGALVTTLVEVGLLERKRKRLSVHGWKEWQEGHARKLERDRDRMKAKRAETRGQGRATVERGSRDGRGREETERRGEGEEPSLRSGRAAPKLPAAAIEESEPPPKQLEVLDLTVGRPPLPDPGPSPFQRVVAHWFEAWERAGRGKHSPLTEAEGATVKRLARALGPDELIARMDRALADSWFLEHGDLMLFAKQREKFARPGRAAPLAPAPLRDPGCPEWERLREMLEKRVRPESFAKFHADLLGRMDGTELVLVARDGYRRDFLVDNHRELLVALARELGIAEDVRIEADEAKPPGAAAAGRAAASLVAAGGLS